MIMDIPIILSSALVASFASIIHSLYCLLHFYQVSQKDRRKYWRAGNKIDQQLYHSFLMM